MHQRYFNPSIDVIAGAIQARVGIISIPLCHFVLPSSKVGLLLTSEEHRRANKHPSYFSHPFILLLAILSAYSTGPTWILQHVCKFSLLFTVYSKGTVG